MDNSSLMNRENKKRQLRRQIVTPMYDLIASNIVENQSLAKTRDSLLPRLMSGELDVSDIQL